MALIPGNLLSENNQSVETSVGGWGSFQTVSSSIVQSTTQAFDGTHSVSSTASATTAGALGGLTTTVDLPVVKAGLTYVWTYFVRSPKRAIFNANLDWYQSNNTTFISSTNSVGQEVLANTWTPIFLPSALAPALSGVARLYLQVTSGLAVSDVVFFDQMFFGLPQYAEIDRLLLPDRGPVFFNPWGGAPDASHDVIAYAQDAARVSFRTPSPRPFLLLGLSSESGAAAQAVTFNDAAPFPPLLTPDDPTGGMQPWFGAPNVSTAVNATVNAGVATVSIAALAPTAGLGALPGVASVTVSASAPTAGLGALPGAGSVTFAAQQPFVGLGVNTGAAAVSFIARAPASNAGALAGSSAITLTARDASVGLAGQPGSASVALSAQAPTAALGSLPGMAPVSLTAPAPTAGLGTLPGVASLTTAASPDTAGLGALPSAAPLALISLNAAVTTVEDQQALPFPLFLPDDPLGGMAPWTGATTGILSGDVSVNAGVATMIVAGRDASVGLGIGAGAATVALVAQPPAAGLGAPAGRATLTLAAQSPTAGLGALPGTATVTTVARQPNAAIGVQPGTAPVSFLAQNPSAAFSSTATAGRATITMAALNASPGLVALPGSANFTVSARAPLSGVGAAPGVALLGLAAYDPTVVVPQAASGITISGREPLGTASGREFTALTYGREASASISGREPVSSRSGQEETDEISGRET